MKNKLNKKIVTLSFLCCLSVIGGGISLGYQPKAIAETSAIKTLEEVSFIMDAGASVRIKSGDEAADNYATTGIRFSATMSADDYTALTSNTNYTSITFGMLITPIENEETNPFTYENVFGANAVYDWAVYDSEKGVWVYEGDGTKTRITNVQSSEMTFVNGEYVMYGSRVGIKDENIDREFFGLGYISVTETDGDISYKFAEFSKDGKESNVRSIAYVAQKAIEDASAKAPSTAAKDNLQTYYVDKVTGNETTYTVEHRQQNADGSYTVLESATVDSTIGATVTATANSNYGAVSRVSSGSVYANGKQTLAIDYAYEPDNKMEYRIVVSPNATQAELFAAEELQYFYKEATGLELPILKSDTPYGYCICIGDTETYSRNQDANLASYGDAGYSIKTVDTDIIINSVSEQGKIYGVYGLLEEVFGLKIYAEEAFDFSNTDVTSIETLNVTEKPSFNAGLLSGAIDGNFKATMRMRMVSNFSEYGISDGWSNNYSSHTFFKLVDPDVYYETNGSWFSNTYNDAQGEPYSLCLYAVLNDTALQNLILTNMKAAIEAEPDANYFMFGYEDYGTYFCTCTNCNSLASQNGGKGWTLYQDRGYVGTYIKATNWLADAIHAWLETAYPERADEVKIGMFAYSSASYPPTSVTINVSDNAFVYFAPIGAEHGDEFSSSSDESTQRLYVAVSRWAELANNITVWNYASAFKDYIAPFDDIETAQGYFKAFETMSPFKMYTQGPRETGMSAFEPLRSYVFSNLMRDTSKSVEDLKNEFFNGYYGAAATELESYYDAIQTKFDEFSIGTGLVQTSLYDSDYWSYDELIGYYDALNNALSKVADTEIYNRVLAETMFARCALFDFYMSDYIDNKGAATVAAELLQFQKDAQACGFTYAYEGWYAYESSIAYKINGWKTNAALISALVDNTEIIKDENYAKTEYSHLYSISVTSGLEFRTDGETVALRHQGTTDALTVNGEFLAKMANAGYTQVTVTATTSNGSDNELSVFKPGSTSEYLASSKTLAKDGGKVTHTLALADLYDATAGAYDFRIQTLGWWSGVTLTINEISFSGVPMTDEEIAAVIDNEDTNWASSEYASLWSVDSPQTIDASGDTVKIPAYVGSSGFIISVSSQLINAAVAAGYTTVTIVSTTNYHNNFRIFPAGTTSASSTTYLATSKTNLEDGGQVTYTIELSKLLNSSTGNYELLMQNGGWSSNSGCSVTYNSLTFGGKPVDPEVLISEGLASENTNWASSEYATFWSVDSPQTIDASGDTVKIPAYVGSSGFIISVSSQLINAAVAAGYTTVTIVSTTNYHNNFRIFPAGTTSASSTTYLATSKTNLEDGGQVTYTIELSKLLNSSTGSYELLMQNGGWSSNSGCSVTYNSLTFAKPVDPMEAINKALKDETTNWASSEYASLWSVDSPQTIDASGDTVKIPAYEGSSGFSIRVSSQVLNAAVEAGYTQVTIASTTNNYTNNFRIFKPGSSSYLKETTGAAGTQVTITVNLSDLLNASTEDYELAMQNGGWWTNGGCSVTYNSLTFSTHYKTANFAESAYAEHWTATNSTLTTSGETVSVKCENGYMLSVSNELLAAAAAAGCTTVTIATNSGNFDNWFDIYNPNWANVTGNSAVKDWKQLSEKPTEREVSWTLDLADLLNDNGEYVLNMTARGWWSGCTWTVTSLTFA